MTVSLCTQFDSLLRCIRESGVVARPPKKGVPFDLNNPEHVAYLRERFYKGRNPTHPSEPKTLTDQAYLDVMVYYYERKESREDIEKIHKIAMASENIVGDILERYIANELEPHGWVWASGAVLQAVDFVYPLGNGQWGLLQIKNRDNSENSSSQKVRNGTTIKKWFRSYSTRKKSRVSDTNWESFPDLPKNAVLNENEFLTFLVEYLQTLKGRSY